MKTLVRCASCGNDFWECAGRVNYRLLKGSNLHFCSQGCKANRNKIYNQQYNDSKYGQFAEARRVLVELTREMRRIENERTNSI